MKKPLLFISLLNLFFLSNPTVILANNGYYNPIRDGSGYRSPIAGQFGQPNNNTTSVTLMFLGPFTNEPYREAGIEPGACYIVGKAYDTTKRVGDSYTDVKEAIEMVNVDEGNNETIANPSDNTRAQFYRRGELHNGDWFEPFWSQYTPAINGYGWTANDFARQVGGDNCGFLKNPIQGSGSDNPVDFIRANASGELWVRNLCESFEGIRNDCSEEFPLGKRFQHTVFRVTCGYYTTTVAGQYRDDVEKGKIDNGAMPDGDKRRNYQMEPDVMCDINKANYNKNTGQKELQIFENGRYEKTFGRDISEKKLWKGAFRLVVFANTHEQGAFTAQPVLTTTEFNPESNTVKTELGTLPRDPAELATAGIRIGIGVGGGLAFLLMVFGSFKLIFAAGNPEAVQSGRETITAAIIGLLVIIFATFILQLIGISILGFNI